jgi:hypothetical protein
MSYLWTSREPTVQVQISYCTTFSFDTSMKLVRLIKICLNKTYSKVDTGKHFSDALPMQNRLKQHAFCHCLSTMILNTPLAKFKKTIRN